jgi:hypothetical protein
MQALRCAKFLKKDKESRAVKDDDNKYVNKEDLLFIKI